MSLLTWQAIFAMPVFNWDGSGAPFIKEGFKYYLAVVIPLTFLVLAVWAFAVLLPWRAWLPKYSLGGTVLFNSLSHRLYPGAYPTDCSYTSRNWLSINKGNWQFTALWTRLNGLPLRKLRCFGKLPRWSYIVLKSRIAILGGKSREWQGCLWEHDQ